MGATTKTILQKLRKRRALLTDEEKRERARAARRAQNALNIKPGTQRTTCKCGRKFKRTTAGRTLCAVCLLRRPMQTPGNVVRSDYRADPDWELIETIERLRVRPRWYGKGKAQKNSEIN